MGHGVVHGRRLGAPPHEQAGMFVWGHQDAVTATRQFERQPSCFGKRVFGEFVEMIETLHPATNRHQGLTPNGDIAVPVWLVRAGA